ncbi:MAG: tetratricopeptide repeat protein, partial [Candidatus Methylomirabilales bacterium]
YNLGLALATVRQDYDGAIAALRGGLELDANDPELWYNLGVAYLSKREFNQAREAFAATIQRDPEHLDARNNLAHALVGLGDLKAARAEWEALLARSPGNRLATANLRALEEQEKRKTGEE